MARWANTTRPSHEATPYAPNSPYSASKAGSDHLVRAYHHTYGLPTLTTNCSNNYGPYHFPEKLIPLMILNALDGKPLPVYGDGLNVRDWLYVRDHCEAIRQVVARGRVGETYNVGGKNEIRNIDVVQILCAQLDALRPRAGGSYAEQITYVADRPGHDRRYAIDPSKIEREIGWRPAETFESGIAKTCAGSSRTTPGWPACALGPTASGSNATTENDEPPADEDPAARQERPGRLGVAARHSASWARCTPMTATAPTSPGPRPSPHSRRLLRPALIVNAAAPHRGGQGRERARARCSSSMPATPAKRWPPRPRACGALLVHYSTDYVFDGSGDQPGRKTPPPAR